MYYLKKLWYNHSEVKIMKFLLFIFLFVFVIISLFTILGVYLLKGFSNIISALFKRDSQEDIYIPNNKEKSNESIIIEGEVVKDSFLQEYIKDINKAKLGIDSDVASALSSLTESLKQMDSYIANHKKNEKDIMMMTEHYIPELLKHIKVYKEFSLSGINSKHKEDIKFELLETINMVTKAYSSVLSEFYDSMALSVSSSLEAIKQSIKMKGYVK